MKHFNHIIAGAMLLAASTTAVHAQVFDKAQSLFYYYFNI